MCECWSVANRPSNKVANVSWDTFQIFCFESLLNESRSWISGYLISINPRPGETQLAMGGALAEVASHPN